MQRLLWYVCGECGWSSDTRARSLALSEHTVVGLPRSMRAPQRVRALNRRCATRRGRRSDGRMRCVCGWTMRMRLEIQDRPQSTPRMSPLRHARRQKKAPSANVHTYTHTHENTSPLLLLLGDYPHAQPAAHIRISHSFALSPSSNTQGDALIDV